MSRFRVPVVMLLVASGWTTSASAQQPPGSERLFGGLFGGSRSANAAHKLDVNASLVGAYDQDLPSGTDLPVPTTDSVGGFSSMFLGAGDYRFQNGSMQIGVTGTSAFRYYHELRELRNVGQTAGVGLSAALDQRTSIMINQSAAYSPAYLYGLFPEMEQPEPGSAPGAAPDYLANDSPSYLFGTIATLSRGLNQRSSLALEADYSYTDFVKNQEDRPDTRSYGMRVRFARNVSRNTTVSTSYSYRGGDLGMVGAGSTTEHGAGFGFSYQKPFSATRRLQLEASLGPSATNVPADVLADVPAGAWLYRVAGDVSLGVLFHRDWQTRATFRRGLEFVSDLSEPVFSDAFTADLQGRLSRRTSLQVAAAYSKGGSVIHSGLSAFDTYTASARFRYAISNTYALYTEYLYYFYDFGTSTVRPPPGSPSTFERNGVRVGVTVWMPVMGR